MHQTSLRELTTLGLKNAENLAIPSVRNDVSIYRTHTLIAFVALGEHYIYNISWGCENVM
jgi:hypothetical protein